MKMKDRIGKTFCPKCGSVPITDMNRFIVIYPKGTVNPKAEVTCEKCNTVYQIEVSWKNAMAFDKFGCPVVGFSFGRGDPIKDDDIVKFLANLDERIENFLDADEKERGKS